MSLTVTDLFCGAAGSSTGAAAALANLEAAIGALQPALAELGDGAE